MSFRIDQLAVYNLATVGGSITAGSFVKSGGTSSQFLKADGSVDSSAYITGITSGMITTALGYTPVPTTRTLTINGTAYDLSADRSWTISAGVSSVSGSGAGISVSPTTGAVVVSNTGVTSNVAGTGISVSGATGAVTITNTGVTSVAAGTGISVSASTGGVTITNTGVTSVNGSTGAITGIITTSNYNSYSPTLTGGGASGTWGINITGNAGYASSAGNADTVDGVHESQIVYGGAGRASNYDGSMNDTNQKSGFFYKDNPTGQPFGDWWNWMTVAGNSWQSSNNYSFQLAHAFHSDDFYVRRMTNGTAYSWRYLLTNANYNSYAPTLTGGGASGTWSINVTGTAGSETLNTVTSRGNITSNAVTVGLLIAQGPGGNYNENVRLPGSTAVISFNTSGATGAGSYNIVSQTNFQIRNAGGSQVFIMDQSGNLTMSGSMRAPIFYDSDDTNYYGDFASTSRLHTVGSFYLQNNYGIATDHTYGIYFDSGRDSGYAIYRESGGWAWPYPDLRIGFHTGIKIGAYYGYNGTRFYNNSDMATITASVNDGDNNFRSYYDVIAYASDRRLKHNIKPIENAVEKVMKLTGMTYEWNDVGRNYGWEPGKEREAGVFAQEVQEVLPEAVKLAPFDQDHDVDGNMFSKSGENFLTVKYEKIVPLLIEAIKEQTLIINKLTERISDLENK